MHNVTKLVASISMVALLSTLALSAKTEDVKAYVDSYQGARPEVPVPLQVVEPALRSEIEGVVELTFVVNAQGLPTNIAITASSNNQLDAPVRDAVGQWKFAPAKRNGEPVARKVVLPVRVVLTE